MELQVRQRLLQLMMLLLASVLLLVLRLLLRCHGAADTLQLLLLLLLLLPILTAFTLPGCPLSEIGLTLQLDLHCMCAHMPLYSLALPVALCTAMGVANAVWSMLTQTLVPLVLLCCCSTRFTPRGAKACVQGCMWLAQSCLQQQVTDVDVKRVLRRRTSGGNHAA
jgi:hypothetical protein